MDELLRTIQAVQEGGKRLANHYLGHGYVLLAIQGGARARRFPSDSVGGSQWYVRRDPVYVLGRPEGVEVAPDPSWWTRPAAAADETEKEDEVSDL